MPAEHDLDPDAMTEAERLAKRRYEAYFAFETQVAGMSGECLRLGHDWQTWTRFGTFCTRCHCTKRLQAEQSGP